MQYEIELKCLVPDATIARQLPGRIEKLGYAVKLVAEYKQFNDYFIHGDLLALVSELTPELGQKKAAELSAIATGYRNFTVRCRQNNDTVLFIVKAAMDGQSANHSTQRIEFETEINIHFDELSRRIQRCGYDIQARWQAERTIYTVDNGITLDSFFSPGYGHVVEFEIIVHEEAAVEAAEDQLRKFTTELDLKELDKQVLEKMFAYYNDHWQDYYGTKKTFRVEDLG